jgi:hypothetical protein
MKIVYYATRFISVFLVTSFIRHEPSEFKKNFERVSRPNGYQVMTNE